MCIQMDVHEQFYWRQWDSHVLKAELVHAGSSPLGCVAFMDCGH